MFEALTRTSWCDRDRWQKRHEPRPLFLFGDYTDWELHADGTFDWHLNTDYVPSPHGAGRWTLERVQDTWVLVLSTGERYPMALAPDGALTIHLQQYWPCRPLERHTEYSESSLPPVRLEERLERLRRALVATEWRRINDMNLDFQPTSVHFSSDWTYVSQYRDGQCRNSGAWYLTREGVIGHAVGHAATNPCDRRAPARPDDLPYPENLHIELGENGRMFLGHEPYSPLCASRSELRKGTTRLTEYGNLEARVEYDMPIKRGRPSTFTAFVRNHSSEPVMLRRFAITSEYAPNYRDPATRLAPSTSELAARDLHSQTLAPGQEVSASLDLTVDHPLKWIYLNLLIDGRTQAWDMHESRAIRLED